MSDKAFLDTNILIYTFAAGDPRQAPAMQQLRRGGAVSIQVFNEFAAISHRKLGLSWDEIGKRIEAVRALLDPPAPLTESNHDEARAIARRHKIAFYDALIVAAAIAQKCDLLLTEDLQHGAKFGALQVRNPFAP